MTTVALGEIVDFYSGGTPSKANRNFWHGDVPWISAKDMKHTRLTRSIDHISEEVFSSTSLRKLPVGTVVMVVRGMILAHTVPIGVLEVEAAINQDLKALLPRGDVAPAYLAAMLRAQHAGILAQVTTAAHGTKKLESRVLERIQIPLPPIEEQRRIADMVDRADALRAKRREELTLLDDLVQSIFTDTFANMWADGRRTLGSLCHRITDGTHQPPKWAPHGHPFIFVRNIISGEIDLKTDKFISDETYAELTRRCPIEVGDVLYSTVGSYGVPVVVRTSRKFAFQRHIAHLKPDRSRILPEFLKVMLASAEVRRQADAAARGVAQKTINLSDIDEYEVIAPPMELQAKFVEKVAAVARARASMSIARQALDDLFVSMQQRAYAGLL